MYYLQSRYYSAEWGRFVNPDGLVGAPGDLLSGNMFAYCKNNPVNLWDLSGLWSCPTLSQIITTAANVATLTTAVGLIPFVSSNPIGWVIIAALVIHAGTSEAGCIGGEKYNIEENATKAVLGERKGKLTYNLYDIAINSYCIYDSVGVLKSAKHASSFSKFERVGPYISRIATRVAPAKSKIIANTAGDALSTYSIGTDCNSTTGYPSHKGYYTCGAPGENNWKLSSNCC